MTLGVSRDITSVHLSDHPPDLNSNDYSYLLLTSQTGNRCRYFNQRISTPQIRSLEVSDNGNTVQHPRNHNRGPKGQQPERRSGQEARRQERSPRHRPIHGKQRTSR